MAKFGGVICALILVVLLPCLDVALGQSTDPSEVNALRAIKGRLVDPMNNLKNWNRGDPCTSNWTGVFCHKVNDDTYLHVTELYDHELTIEEKSACILVLEKQLFKRNLSGTLAPEVSLLSRLKTLDFMWNDLTGSIPEEIGNITTLKLILLNGNQLSGILPDEIGNLQNLNRLQVDQNQLFGPIPKSFANLRSVKHLHMNNNSLSGSIPSELSRLPLLLHLLVDNNNLSGPLPPEFAEAPALKILCADNNNFSGSSIPTTYSNISTLLKLDISWNQLTGSIPTNNDFSHNMLNGTIPQNFSGLPNLQILSLEDNKLNGSIPSTIWNDMILTGNRSLVLDFQNNSLNTIPATFDPPPNVTVMLYGNPVCRNTNRAPIIKMCQPTSVNQQLSKNEQGSTFICQPCPTDKNYEYNPSSPIPCFCAVPLGVGLRLKSPGITDFRPYEDAFEINLTSLLQLFIYQLNIDHYIWEVGPRLNMHMKLFPSNASLFNISEIVRLRHVLAGWEITLSDVFGPYELLNFTLGSYADEFPNAASAGLSKAALGGILAGSIAAAITLSVVATTLIIALFEREHLKIYNMMLFAVSRFSVKIDGVRCFTFEEMAKATNNFDLSAQVGQGGYGKVYKGILADGATVAIKRAHEDSLQGSKEFCTEIELLSRLHHRNLVSLVGYCDEEDEQMLVYEFMSNGTLRDHISAKSKRPLSFGLRLKIALGAAKGILYLHTEADPPIFHRDVKASNILLDSKFVAKVADFGLSRLAPVPDVEGTIPAHVSTVVKGTPGYLDPEYFLTHKLTDKSDVYSLGVVLLEMLTGMRPIEHGKNIVREVNSACHSGNISEIIDGRMGLYPPECVRRFLSLATKCCQDETDARPSMWEIVRELELILRMMPEEDLALLETSETDSTDVSKSLSASATGTLFISSQVSGSLDGSSGMISGRVTPR
ncbi:putative LRR receptor-like serine/threonine-protein kinase [Dichanthelium oligosanthes]|uniref:non-specific serine/threonine protein kinase n=1 Tax=Dichanthelium oligosanthes TaxID=888268 RepID=A0A1E5W5W5_9POAL|nr:putative LRR receptor-like serine/threonine-protein kinase [Dichanthelium oligosanthes]